MTTTTFFSLPRELRDYVYKYFIYTPCKPPATPSDAGLRFRKTYNPDRVEWMEYKIFYPLDPRPYAYIMPLWDCSGQIRREVHEALSPAKAYSDGSCKLDLMFKGRTSTLTWIQFPCWPEHMRRLEISVRIFDPPYKYRNQDMFVRILTQLVQHGPLFGYSNLQKETNFHLETLTVNITADQGMQHMCNAQIAQIEEDNSELIYSHFHFLGRAGLLTGFIDRVHLRTSNSEKIVETAKYSDYKPRDPADFGLSWGVDTSLLLREWLNKDRWAEAE